jgi:hypothetical protein
LHPADRLVRIPAGVSDDQAASAFLKGLNTHYCIDLFLSRLTECSEAAVLQIHPKGLKREPNIDIGAFLIPMWTILRE